ncbi:MAG: queuosine precursor transporter [Bacillota bacterium]
MKQYRLFDLVACSFVATLLISNIVAVKVVSIFGMSFSGAIILFPVTYIFGDILTEVYGYAQSRKAIWMGFGAQGLLAVIVSVVGVMKPAQGWELQGAYEQILMVAPRMALASLAAYVVGSFLNSIVLSRVKVATSGRHLWIRTISSTVVGELADSLIFFNVALFCVLPSSVIGAMIVNSWVFKSAYEILATPFTYAVVGWLKRSEGVDAFDTNASYNPFSLAQ